MQTADGQLTGTAPNLTHARDNGFEGTDTFWFTASNCGFSSSWQSATIHVAPPPVLTATCGPDRILLRWAVQPWVGDLLTDFQIKRKVLGGSYSVIHTAGASNRAYEDTDVSSGVTYCYVVVMRRQDSCTSVYYEVESNEVCLQTCSLPPCNQPTISGWVFMDEGFIGPNGTLSGEWRIYNDPSQVPASPWSFPKTPECLGSSSGLLLRMDFENDNNCEEHDPPFNSNIQIATAEAVISVGCLTRFTVNWCGMAEQHKQPYELMTLHVNEVLMADAHAPGGDEYCAPMAPAVPRAGSPEPPHYIDLNPGIYILRIKTDTVDNAYHYDAYYEFEFSFEPQ